MENNDLKVGDTVHHKLDPGSRMVIIKVNENVYSCKYYGKGKFYTKDLYGHEIKLDKPYEEDPSITFEIEETVRFPSKATISMIVVGTDNGKYQCRFWDKDERSFVDETFEAYELTKDSNEVFDFFAG